MFDNLSKQSRNLYNKIIHGIAFVPAIIGIGFLTLAIAGVELDKSELGSRI
jgi:hypothetical protein